MLAGIEHLSAPGGLPAFAHANGLRYDDTAAPPTLGESLWERVSNGIVRNKVSGEGWEVGRITGGTRAAENVEQHGRWTVTTSVTLSTPEQSIDLGYLAITLPRRLPQMVLDARSNDRGPFSSLLNAPIATQHLSLEGDFDTHFRLYVPAGYERDALYVFTPDLMALLIDETGDLDVEIRDDRLIVYKPGGFDFTDPHTWARFEHIRATVGAKAWDRTDMYVDDRVDAPTLQFADTGAGATGAGDVAEGGRRLRKRVPNALWLGLGVLVVVLGVFAAVAAIRVPAFLR